MASDPSEARDPAAGEVEKALGSATEEASVHANGDSSSGCKEAAGSSSSGPPEEKEAEKTLELADELFEEGSKALEMGDFVDAVDCLSRALEIRVSHYGEVAPECATSYYKYGYALLYKAQEEADPLVNVPKNTPKVSEKAKSLENVEGSGSSRGSCSDIKQDNAPSNNEEVEEGANDKDQDDDEESSDGDGEELAEGDEDESDLDLAWKMLDVARAIVEKNPEDTIEKVNILAALGEVSMEREDFETSLTDYLKALSILERLVEPDHRRIVELNFRVCMVLEVGSKIEEAIPYCQKAITLCKSRLERLNNDMSSIGSSENNVTPESNSDKSGNQALDKTGTEPPSLKEDEKETLSGILSELERKLEELQNVSSNPKSVFSELMKMVASKSASPEANLPSTVSRSESLQSSQMGVATGGFDSPTISTAATNGGVTHLGVVGRGVKRASLNPIGAEPAQKKPVLDSSSEKDSSTNISEVLDTPNQR